MIDILFVSINKIQIYDMVLLVSIILILILYPHYLSFSPKHQLALSIVSMLSVLHCEILIMGFQL